MVTQTVERRTSPRVRTYLPVRMHLRQAPWVIETLTKDVSLHGMRCVSPTSCPVSSELRVELSLAQGQEPLTVSGRTAWFRMIAHSEQFDLGIAFTNIPPETERRLSTYLDRLSR